jgi:hypothetical protein
MASSLTDGRQTDPRQELEALLRPEIRERVRTKREKWLDEGVSPFAKQLHRKAEPASARPPRPRRQAGGVLDL